MSPTRRQDALELVCTVTNFGCSLGLGWEGYLAYFEFFTVKNDEHCALLPNRHEEPSFVGNRPDGRRR